jgi:hypothetical protein
LKNLIMELGERLGGLRSQPGGRHERQHPLGRPHLDGRGDARNSIAILAKVW